MLNYIFQIEIGKLIQNVLYLKSLSKKVRGYFVLESIAVLKLFEILDSFFKKKSRFYAI